MRKITGKNVLRTSAFALACLALTGAGAKADAVAHTYSTGYTIGDSGISSPDGSTPGSPISFTPVVTGAYTTPSALGLGAFQVATLAAGKEVDYNNTPFTITYNPLTIAGVNYPTASAPVTITGTLTGAITGSTSSVVASFNSISSPTFSSGQYVSAISVLDNPLSLVPSSAGGITTVQAEVTTTAPSTSPLGTSVATPEPTTLAILATAIIGLGLRGRLRSGRKSS